MAKTNLETVCHVYLDGDLLLVAEVGGGLSLDVAMCLDLGEEDNDLFVGLDMATCSARWLFSYWFLVLGDKDGAAIYYGSFVSIKVNAQQLAGS